MSAGTVLTARVSGLAVEVLGAGAPLLVAHGGPGADHTLYRTLDPLAAGRRLVFWDQRGHGASDPFPPGPVEMRDFADDVVRVADGLGIETFALFGHSFGGWVAQEAALRHPDRVALLVLAGTTPGQLGQTESPTDEQGPPPPAELAELMSRIPASDEEARRIYRELGPFFLRTADPAPYQALVESTSLSADTMNRVFDALSRWSSVDRLAEIGCPTLLLAGRYDVFCSVAQHERIARRLVDPDLVVVDRAGHMMWMERPEVLELLDDWLVQRGW
jgi:proline iminopeptidase